MCKVRLTRALRCAARRSISLRFFDLRVITACRMSGRIADNPPGNNPCWHEPLPPITITVSLIRGGGGVLYGGFARTILQTDSVLPPTGRAHQKYETLRISCRLPLGPILLLSLKKGFDIQVSSCWYVHCGVVLDAFPVSSKPALATVSRHLLSAVALSCCSSGQF